MWLLRCCCCRRLLRDLLAASVRGRAAAGRMSAAAFFDPLFSRAIRSGEVPHVYPFLAPAAKGEALFLPRVPTKPLRRWRREPFFIVPGAGETQAPVLAGDPS